MEGVDSLHLLACTDEFDGFLDHGADGERSTATGVAVKFGEHHSVEIQTVVELFCGVDSVLTCHRIDHKESLIGIDGIFQRLYLIHHFLIDSQSTGSIDDDDIVPFRFRLLDTVICYLDDIFIVGL